MSRKKYYAYFPRNFGNEYRLYSVEDEQDEMAIDYLYDHLDENSDLFRVSVKTLRKWTSEEKFNRKFDPAFSGYCDLFPDNVRKASVSIGKRVAFEKAALEELEEI